MKKIISFLFLVLFLIDVLQANEWLIKEEFLTPEREGFDCHSSSIIETTLGELCVVWKGGPGIGSSNNQIKENVGIWLSLFDGEIWSEPKEIVSAPNSVCWNPVLCQTPSEELLLFYRIGCDPRKVVSFLKRSSDQGHSWSSPEMLPAGIMGPTKNKPLLTSQGKFIIPSSVEVGSPEDIYKATACWIEICNEDGQHWEKIGPLELPQHKFGVIEPALFYDREGKMHMLCRDRAYKMGEQGYIWSSISHDEGRNWSEFVRTDLPNPDSGLDVVDLGEGTILLIYNHSHTKRFPLNLAISDDGGDSWREPIVLDEKGEFPSAVLSKDGLLHITYAVPFGENGQRRIKHIVIEPKLIPPDF